MPIGTFNDWKDPAPGFCEVDMVAHGGTSVAGSFIQLIDVAGMAEQIQAKFAIPAALKDIVLQIEATVGMSITRTAAFVLFIYTAIVIFYMHDFWNMAGPDQMIQHCSGAKESLDHGHVPHARCLATTAGNRGLAPSREWGEPARRD